VPYAGLEPVIAEQPFVQYRFRAYLGRPGRQEVTLALQLTPNETEQVRRALGQSESVNRLAFWIGLGNLPESVLRSVLDCAHYYGIDLRESPEMATLPAYVFPVRTQATNSLPYAVYQRSPDSCRVLSVGRATVFGHFMTTDAAHWAFTQAERLSALLSKEPQFPTGEWVEYLKILQAKVQASADWMQRQQYEASDRCQLRLKDWRTQTDILDRYQLTHLSPGNQCLVASPALMTAERMRQAASDRKRPAGEAVYVSDGGGSEDAARRYISAVSPTPASPTPASRHPAGSAGTAGSAGSRAWATGGGGPFQFAGRTLALEPMSGMALVGVALTEWR
jgi:hypothetical protein